MSWTLVVASALLFHVLAHIHLSAYYLNHLPHYDSMGAYTAMFDIVSVQETQGLWAALSRAIHYDLSWLQGLFAALGAPLLSKTPASLQLYNTICVACAMSAIFLAARTSGLSVCRAWCAALAVFLPDVLYEVQGGLMDLQRDPSYLMLLTAAVFGFLAFHWRPSCLRALVVGLFSGLATISRSNAFPFLVVLLAPLLLWSTYVAWQEKRLRVHLLYFLAMCTVYMSLAGAFLVLRFPAEMARYQNPFVAYAIGDSVYGSVKAHWMKPAELLVGQLLRANSLQTAGRTVSLWVLGIGSVLSVLLWATGILRFRVRAVLSEPRNQMVLAIGAWALGATMGLLCLVAKVKDLSFGQAKHPFYPVLIGVFALLFIAVQMPRPSASVGNPRRVGYILAASFFVFVASIGVARVGGKVLKGNRAEVEAIRDLAHRFRCDGGQTEKVAFLWFEGFSFDTVRFYNAANGQRSPDSLLYQFDGHWLDFAVSAPTGVDPEKMMCVAEERILGTADLVVLSTSPQSYHLASSQMALFQSGSGLVQRVLASERFEREQTFEFRGGRFALLRRK